MASLQPWNTVEVTARLDLSERQKGERAFCIEKKDLLVGFYSCYFGLILGMWLKQFEVAVQCFDAMVRSPTKPAALP